MFVFGICCRKRLDGTLQDLEDQQNSKRDSVSILLNFFTMNLLDLNRVYPKKSKFVARDFFF